ncbi:hypothetical protein SLEP1_g57708 [Rubroshorea leprosula]|uniref:Reverse transcriptase Ty1/copia-type domain-containing protein n=1 Tax=Rubroshorea leprosula TaxID=152421 RepID=A0AAV5MM84_9ROSI|nr:hypothetical protein SLEP1_g57708 [Rubroshorea leprosula]
MKTFFVSQDLWDLVENEFAKIEKSPVAEVKDLWKKDAKALLILQQAVIDSIFPRIANATKSKEAWTILNQEFYGDDKVTIVKLQTLRKEFENLCMKGSESVQDFISRVSVIINQLKTYGDQVDDRKVVEKVLRCLPPKFDHVVAAIEESKDFSVYSLNQLMGSLLAREERMNRFAKKNMEQAFQTKGGSSSTRQKYENGERGNQKQCHFCKKHGHIEANYWEKAKQQANFVEEKEVEENLFLTCLIPNGSNSDLWFLDSGCSNHMTGCAYGKQHRNAFPVGKAWRAKEPLETVVEMARSMLNEKKLPQTFWAEVVATTIHILNISPTKAVRNMTPYEAWWKRKPNNLIIHRDVVFDENNAWEWNEGKIQHLLYEESESNEPQAEETEVGQQSSPTLSSPTMSPQFALTPQPQRMFTISMFGAILRKEKPWKQVYDPDTYALLVAEPTCYDEAYGKQEWEKSMKEEIDSIEKNNTWELVDKPKGKTPIGVKWVYRVKYKADGSVQKYKARLVAKGYVQKHGIDFLETFFPVARFETIRLVIALAAQMKWKIFLFDVKSAFLNGWLEEDVYVEQLEGFIVQAKEEKVYKLKKAFYGLKQAPQAWYGSLDSYLHDNDFHRNENEPTLYVKVKGGDILIICVYVDDIIYTSSSNILIEEFKKNMSAEFDMSDLGLLHYFLGLQIYQTDYVPWIISGDFNTTLNYGERVKPSGVVWGDTSELKDFVSRMEVFDLQFSGAFFTWSNKQGENDRLWCKLDRVMANSSWVSAFPNTSVVFLNPQSSDHSPSLVTVDALMNEKPRPFRFCNAWSKDENFLDLVREAWSVDVQGCPIFAKEVWRLVLNFLNIHRQPKRWSVEWLWLKKVCKGRSTQSNKLKAAVAATIYMIWQERNRRVTLIDDGTPRANEKYFRSMVGGLMYLTHTRPDIMFSVSLVSRFMHNPFVHHLGTAKRILCYIRATSNFGIWYKPMPNFKLLGFTNSDWAGSVDDRKSTSGYIFNLGSGVVSWSSKKQECTALPSSEAEYVAATSTACQAIWMRRIMKDLQQVQEKATKIFCDNKATILMTKNPMFHGRTKHIELRHHFIQGAVADGLIALEYCSTSDQVVDGFTKGFCFSKFMKFHSSLGVAEFASRGDVEN